MGSRSPDGPRQSEKRGKRAAPWQMTCKVTVARGRSRVVRSGVAAIGNDELRFHTGRTGRQGPDFFVHIAFADISSLVVDEPAGTLTVTTEEHGAVVFALGRAAPEWKERIEARPGRLDRLGIKPASRVALVGFIDDELEAELAGRLQDEVAGDLDVVLAGAEHPADLPRLAALGGRLRSRGVVVWAVYPAGSRAIGEREIAAAAAAAGLAPGDSIELSRTHRALRLTR
jgi:hypothetical protein